MEAIVREKLWTSGNPEFRKKFRKWTERRISEMIEAGISGEQLGKLCMHELISLYEFGERRYTKEDIKVLANTLKDPAEKNIYNAYSSIVRYIQSKLVNQGTIQGLRIINDLQNLLDFIEAKYVMNIIRDAPNDKELLEAKVKGSSLTVYDNAFTNSSIIEKIGSIYFRMVTAYLPIFFEIKVIIGRLIEKTAPALLIEKTIHRTEIILHKEGNDIAFYSEVFNYYIGTEGLPAEFKKINLADYKNPKTVNLQKIKRYIRKTEIINLDLERISKYLMNDIDIAEKKLLQRQEEDIQRRMDETPEREKVNNG